MKILFIAPLPIKGSSSGQTKVSQLILEAIQTDNEVEVINFAKLSLKNGVNSIGRIFEVLAILYKILQNRKNNDLIYLSLSESLAGNLKDLVTYSILFQSRSKIIIHMLGGAGMRSILQKNNWQSKLNHFFVRQFRGVIVEGQVNFDMFSKIIPNEKIKIVPNFADDFLFANENEIKEKFLKTNPLKLLYLSNLIPGKGYDELVDGYIQLPDALKQEVEITFVGGFESEKSKHDFFDKTKLYKNLRYIGDFIEGNNKKNIYGASHVFCLPTYYPFEGQPISILEAYATGCVVMTTNHSGIPYTFSDKINGYEVDKKSPESITITIEKMLEQKNKLVSIAITNNEIAYNKYRTKIFQSSILDIFANKIK